MAVQFRIGMLTPSGNTGLEPITCELVHKLNNVSVHFSRLAVTRVGLDDDSAGQFTFEGFKAAASLLVDARVQAIAWNGTSGSWMGVSADQELCRKLEDALGVPFTTSTLAMLEAFREYGLSRYSLAVPYSRDMADRIVEEYARQGLTCVNLAFRNRNTVAQSGAMDEDMISDLLTSAAHPDAQCIAVVCTNVRAAPLVDRFERDHGLTVLDSITVTAWKCLKMVGAPRAGLAGWGRLFADPGQPESRARAT
jgi:maleate isomerase